MATAAMPVVLPHERPSLNEAKHLVGNQVASPESSALFDALETGNVRAVNVALLHLRKHPMDER